MDCFGVPRHVDSQEKSLTEIIVRCWVMTVRCWVMRIFQPNEYVFGDCFGVPRHADAQEKFLTEIIICSSVLTVPGGFSTD